MLSLAANSMNTQTLPVFFYFLILLSSLVSVLATGSGRKNEYFKEKIQHEVAENKAVF